MNQSYALPPRHAPKRLLLQLLQLLQVGHGNTKEAVKGSTNPNCMQRV